MSTSEELLDSAYRERAHLVAHLAALYPSVIAHGTDPNAPGFAIVYVTLPGGAGSASWHIAERDLDLFEHVHRDDAATWDGHTTEEKYRRLDVATEEQGQWQTGLWGPAVESDVPFASCQFCGEDIAESEPMVPTAEIPEENIQMWAHADCHARVQAAHAAPDFEAFLAADQTGAGRKATS